MKIKTDNKWREFKYRGEVPKKVLSSQFDGTDAEDGFFKHKGYWYHLSQFMRGGPPGWDGTAPDSYFSGTLLKLSRDGEQYKVGTYTS